MPRLPRGHAKVPLNSYEQYWTLLDGFTVRFTGTTKWTSGSTCFTFWDLRLSYKVAHGTEKKIWFCPTELFKAIEARLCAGFNN